MSDFQADRAAYVATEVEKMILSQAAESYGEQAIKHFTGNVVDLNSHFNTGTELIDLLPDQFPALIHRQRIDDRLMWTVTITRTRDPMTLASTGNSQAGRSRSRNHATLAAIIRLYFQELAANATKE